MPKSLDPSSKLHIQNERLRRELSALKAQNRKLLQRNGRYDEFLEELQDIVKSESEFKFKAQPVGKAKLVHEPSHEEIAAVACSDLHLGENVRLEESNGINIYNSMVAANRLWEHAQKVKSILSRHMTLYKIKQIWVPLLGDMINGTIHAEQITTNDLSDPAAVVLGSRLVTMFLEELKSLGLPIVVDAIHGNHPRTTHKMPTKRQAHSNLDWQLYEIVAAVFAKDKQVDMTVHTGQIGMRMIYGHRYLFEHGFDVKSGGEEGIEDRIRALFDDPIYRAATGLQGASFDQIVQGNMHKSKFLERTIINGTYVAQNELGMSWRLKPIKALQNMWGISKKHARTFQYQLDLTHVRSDKVTNAFSEYTSWFMKRHGQ
jgi:hypothetical protein